MIFNLAHRAALAISLSTLAFATGCSDPKTETSGPSLRKAYADKFLLGATLNGSILDAPDHPGYGVLEDHFGAITAANAMKWGEINPLPGVYDFEHADRLVEYGVENGLTVIGHVLFWHSQTPDWVFEDAEGNPLSREALLDRMRERAAMMAERYGDHVKIWDVVNESIEGDGSWRESKFHQIIGPDWNAEAFRIAEEALPDDAVLLYNDYGMTEPGRRDAVVAMVKDFQERGIRIDGIGMQGHWSMHRPSLDEIEAAYEAFASTGLPIHITELDVDLLGRDDFFGADVDIRRIEATPENNPYADGNLPEAEQQRFTERYAELFQLMLKHHDKIDRVTLWGVGDGDSWLNNWPVRGRTNFPLLFDRDYQPKPVVQRLIELAE